MLAMRWAPVAFALFAIAWAHSHGAAQQAVSDDAAADGATADDPARDAIRPIPDDVDLSPAFLDNVDHVKAGRKLWAQCSHCHGRTAYPGKAPKLRPELYDAAFVYDRITYGFDMMPPWEDVFDATERAQLVAYILSNRFAP